MANSFPRATLRNRNGGFRSPTAWMQPEFALNYSMLQVLDWIIFMVKDTRSLSVTVYKLDKGTWIRLT